MRYRGTRRRDRGDGGTTQGRSGATAILHLGDQKTGTKSIQQMIRGSDATWRAHGVASPAATKGGAYDIGLAAALRPDSARWRRVFTAHQGLPVDSDLIDVVRRGLAAECAAGVRTAVFSFEGLLWLTAGEIATLRQLLDEFFGRVEAVVFLRRQDRKAVSLYSTKLLLGRGSLELLPAEGDFDYGGALGRWREHLDGDAIAVHVYEDEPDTARVFAGHLDPALPIVWPERQNESVGGKAQEVLRALRAEHATELPPGGEAMELRFTVGDALADGDRAMPTEREARAFVDRFAEGNEAVRATFRPDRVALFDDDFSAYRHPPADNVFTADDVARVALAVWERARRR